MSLRNGQCEKVCRIIDDVLANRPTERDSLIVAVQKAFKSLERLESASPNSSESPNGWIPCTPETKPRGSQIVLLTLPEHIDDYGQEFCSSIICGHYIGGKDCEWGISDGSRVGYGLVSARYGVSPIAWMPLPAPFRTKEDES